MIAIPVDVEEAMAMFHLKENEFEQAIEAAENALAQGQTGEQELNTTNEVARDLAKLAERISDLIEEKLESL
jgi:F0F1-type ATP synthase epsilon subunit